MRQFNFTTNIEHRMPTTGMVYCIDRMTSDYAEQHPLDVDGFIESVYQEFAGSEFEESREALRNIWTAVLSVTSPCGDASFYPNNNGARRAAAMKVWHKAGDYWRRGLRIGDTLPDRVPMCKITRLYDGGWIALFPKDMHLLSEPSTKQEVVTTEARNEEITPEPEPLPEPKQEPKQLDLFACSEKSKPKRKKKHHHAQVRRQQQPQAVATTVAVAAAVDSNTWLKTAGYLAAASVALLVIWQTGLIIPLGLIGLATSGFLK